MTNATTAPKQNPLPARRPSLAELNAEAAVKKAVARMSRTGTWTPA